ILLMQQDRLTVRALLGGSTTNRSSACGYTFRLDGFARADGPNYEATRATVSVLSGSRVVATLSPEKRLYHVTQMPMTEADIDTGFTRDLYVSLGEPVDDAWIVRVYFKPFVDWIWGGGFVMALGGLIALTDRRYRLARREARRAAVTPVPGAVAAAP
ncbi:MAG: c-type cytochrome biogenesis protein CcmF, partial [Burkholderiales bacterium]|nr:c-type cytochrome biogenesis protein CcmF [Burkholderiales bacterium]